MSTIGAIIGAQAGVVAGAPQPQRADNPAVQASQLTKAVQSGAQAIVLSAHLGRPDRTTTQGDAKKVDASFEKERTKKKEKSEGKSSKKTVNITA